MLLALAPAGCVSSAGVWRGQVVSVVDGASLFVRHGDESVPVKLHGLSVPRPGRPGGLLARRFMVVATLGKQVEVQEVRWDRKDRLVAVVRRGAKNLAERMLRSGLGWHDSRDGAAPRLARAEAVAARGGEGIWQETAVSGKRRAPPGCGPVPWPRSAPGRRR